MSKERITKDTAEAASAITRKALQADGFDSPVNTRAQDHLNRWTFAREVYRALTSGAVDCAVRVGIYGEWGTGKTSVLKFIARMANTDGHVVVWFDPWEFSDSDALWRAFVLSVYRELEERFGALKQAAGGRRKALVGKVRTVLKDVAPGLGKLGDKVAPGFGSLAGAGLSVGLDVLKRSLSFREADLTEIREVLGTKRICILIDDLDRTAQELVPEILFALKELMDIPGFSFACAFDPVVVGKVLHQRHPGFGDGLKFLEKIIDYPRWLPPPDLAGLTKLALFDAERRCAFAPPECIRDAVQLLPQNPRAVRQFIRLISLLAPQIERYYPEDLRWPSIVTATMMKVRFPRLAYALLRDSAFWNRLDVLIMGADRDREAEEIAKLIDEQISSLAKELGETLQAPDEAELKRIMQKLSSQALQWIIKDGQTFSVQTEIAEAPLAITRKECDDCFNNWRKHRNSAAMISWIKKHARDVGSPKLQVYRELLAMAVRSYAAALRETDQSLRKCEHTALSGSSDDRFEFLNTAIFSLPDLGDISVRISPHELEVIYRKLTPMVDAVSPAHERHRERIEHLLLKFIETWVEDVSPLMQVVRPFTSSSLPYYEGVKSNLLHQRLCAAIIPRLARQVAAMFREPGFVTRLRIDSAESYSLRLIALESKSLLWAPPNGEAGKVLTEAAENPVVQENAYWLLDWFDEILEDERKSGENATALVKQFLSSRDVVVTLWQAATATPLSTFMIRRLQRLPEQLTRLGVNVELPKWWLDQAPPIPVAKSSAEF